LTDLGMISGVHELLPMTLRSGNAPQQDRVATEMRATGR
jgi:hypothetical protein